jgi:hypothetical protein
MLLVLCEICGYQGCDYEDYRYMECDAVYFNKWEETSRKFFPNVDILHSFEDPNLNRVPEMLQIQSHTGLM